MFPKIWFWSDFGGRSEDIWLESTPVLRIARFHFSDIFGPVLTRRAVAFGMGIAICRRRKFGQVWGSPARLPKVAENLRCRKAPLWTFDYHMEKSESFCDAGLTPGL